MFKKLFNLKGDNKTLLMIVCALIILIVIFYPRTTPLFGASLAANIGNIGGKVQFEAYDNEMFETLDEGFEGKTLALFYAPWCPHCKSIMPTWDQMAKQNSTDIKIVKVNCDENTDLAEKHGIQGFPTIKFLPLGLNNPKNAIEYKGDRSGEAMLAFISDK